MALSEDQVKKLLDWFISSSETRKKWGEHRKGSWRSVRECRNTLAGLVKKGSFGWRRHILFLWGRTKVII